MHLDKNEPEQIALYLRRRGLIYENEFVESVEKAGEGNMNYTLRIKTSDKSLILKQARPYVEKYPSIPAPVERASMESAFYKTAAKWPGTAAQLPRLIDFDEEEHIQVVEDLGAGRDFTQYYRKNEKFPSAYLKTLLDFLKELHTQSKSLNKSTDFRNRAMRELNHFHMYVFPFDKNNGFDLDGLQPGLKRLAEKYLYENGTLIEKIRQQGALYLKDGNTLLHGDYFPGSWLHTDRGVFIIDPEFCFKGFPEFDLGILHAHLIFCGMDWEEASLQIKMGYPEQKLELSQLISATEVLRRWYGVAQLATEFSIEEKAEWTAFLTDFIINTEL
jgi:5-methylthioribose kinase